MPLKHGWLQLQRSTWVVYRHEFVPGTAFGVPPFHGHASGGDARTDLDCRLGMGDGVTTAPAPVLVEQVAEHATGPGPGTAPQRSAAAGRTEYDAARTVPAQVFVADEGGDRAVGREMVPLIEPLEPPQHR